MSVCFLCSLRTFPSGKKYVGNVLIRCPSLPAPAPNIPRDHARIGSYRWWLSPWREHPGKNKLPKLVWRHNLIFSGRGTLLETLPETIITYVVGPPKKLFENRRKKHRRDQWFAKCVMCDLWGLEDSVEKSHITSNAQQTFQKNTWATGVLLLVESCPKCVPRTAILWRTLICSGFAKMFLGSGIPIYKPSFADILDWVVDPMTVIPAEFPGHWLADIFFSTWKIPRNHNK